jgi:hypothetical protein
MKIWHVIKFFLYNLIGIGIIVFTALSSTRQYMISYVQYILGGIMLMYSIEDMVVSIIKGPLNKETRLFTGLILLIISILLIFFLDKVDDYQTILVIWAIWSIIREGEDITEASRAIAHEKLQILNIIEAVVIIIMSFVMVIDPNEHHAYIHLYLLGIEVILEVFFPALYDHFAKKKQNEHLIINHHS